MKTVYILRGVSGSGKSTLATSLVQNSKNYVICEADQYFINEFGEYNFDPTKLGAAHLHCRGRFEKALKSGVEIVVCSNTNTTKKEYDFYLQKAQEYGYTVHVMIVERVFDTKSVHQVPEESLKRQAQNVLNSISL